MVRRHLPAEAVAVAETGSSTAVAMSRIAGFKDLMPEKKGGGNRIDPASRE